MNSLRLFTTVLLLVSATLSYGQRNKKTEEAFYSFDENWNTASVNNSKYFIRRTKISDTCWQWDTYNMFGPMIRSEQSLDEKGATPHGRLIIFNAKGKADSICSYHVGTPNGKWYIYTDPFYNIVLTYDMGNLVKTDKTVKVKGGNQPKDSAKKGEEESVFRGGLPSWQRYLNRNLRYPKRAIDARIMGGTTVSFAIDSTGNVEDCYIYQSVEYSLDEEALRIIRESPSWIPATKDGKQVKSYKRQPIIFKLP